MERQPPNFVPGHKPGVRLSKAATIANAPCPAEGNGSFDNLVFASIILLSPFTITRIAIPVLTIGFWRPSFGLWSYLFCLLITGLPVAIGYWHFMSSNGPRINYKCKLPNKPLTDYLVINDPELAKKYTPAGGPTKKIPMQICHDAYFDGKIDFKPPPGQTEPDVLSALEYRFDWADFRMTPQLFKQVFFNLIPDVIFHTSRQDSDQVGATYNIGNDFYEWFLGPRMIYTSGVVTDENKYESLEELQDNKLKLVCHKLDIQPGEKVLDIGCGWGTLVTFAAKNYGCDATGVTLSKEQAQFGQERIKNNGLGDDKARILTIDFRDLPKEPAGRFNKIVSLEMAEHVGIRRYQSFLSQVYNLLDDEGTFLLQVAGLRPSWQYHDLVWGLFMNKYIFPGADASCSLGWVVNQVESAGFEVKSVDVLGVHYSATIWRWYQNWLNNKDKVVEKYGERTFRIMCYFLASAVIVAREGGSSLFQLTLKKNLNATHRIEGVSSHTSLHFEPKVNVEPVD